LGIFYRIGDNLKESPASAFGWNHNRYYVTFFEWDSEIKKNVSTTSYFERFNEAKNFIAGLLLKKWLYWNNQNVLPVLSGSLNNTTEMKRGTRKMDLQVKESVEAINSELAVALSYEDKFSKFNALGEVANLTSSNVNIPSFLKDRILKRIDDEQKKMAYCEFYPAEQEVMDEDARHLVLAK